MYSCGNIVQAYGHVPQKQVASNLLRPKFARDQRGTTAVEFALVLPFFLMAVLGTIEFGRALAAWNDASRALSQAVRDINLDPSKTTNQVSALLKKYLVDAGAKDVSVSVTSTTISGADYMKITASFPFNLTIPFASKSDFNIGVDTLAPVLSPTQS